eukprot:501793-Rhodomonas_salina.3
MAGNVAVGLDAVAPLLNAHSSWKKSRTVVCVALDVAGLSLSVASKNVQTLNSPPILAAGAEFGTELGSGEGAQRPRDCVQLQLTTMTIRLPGYMTCCPVPGIAHGPRPYHKRRNSSSRSLDFAVPGDIGHMPGQVVAMLGHFLSLTKTEIRFG